MLRRTVLLILIVGAFALTSLGEQPELRWFRGNTHTHTLNSDGDSTPDKVVRWYRENGYHFVAITDHNFLTGIDGLNALHGADGEFLVIPGEEVTDVFAKAPIHVNGLDLEQLVPPQGGESVSEVLQRNVDAIRKAGGVPHINHPNYRWAISTDDLLRIQNDNLFEIFNGHPQTNNFGGGGAPGLEEVWDVILTSGKMIYGIAVDDAHVFKKPWDPSSARPGQGWVVVRAPKLEARAIVEALERGDFYASTGVEIEEIKVGHTSMTIRIKERSETKFTTSFIGSSGRLLSISTDNPAVYGFNGNEGYVRAKVVDSNAKIAWIQPIRVANDE